MWIICLANNAHEMSISKKQKTKNKKKKNPKNRMSFATIVTEALKVK